MIRGIRSRGLAAAALVSLLILLTSTAPAAAEGVDEARTFRQQFGFASDTTTIVRVAQNPDSSREFGVPLTPAEVAELHRRHEIATQLEPLSQALETDPRFGDMYILQSEGGRIHIGVVDWDPSFTDLVESLLPPGSEYSLDPVEYSNQELQAVREQIAAQFADLNEEFGLRRLVVDPPSNRVELGIDPFSSAAADALVARFGKTVNVVPIQPMSRLVCVSRFNCPDPSFKGGLQIQWPIPGGGGAFLGCTSAFMARKTGTQGFNESYLLTAGHCVAPAGGGSGINQTWKHNNISIGTSKVYNFFDGMAADVAVIKLSAFHFPQNTVFKQNPGAIQSITAKLSNAQQIHGIGVCRAGQDSDSYICGVITAENVDVEFDGILQTHQWEGSMTSQDGDSGGPVMFGSAAFGILSYGGVGITGWGTIDWASGGIGYRPCYRASFNPC